VSEPITIARILDLYLIHSIANQVHGPEALANRKRTFELFVAEYGNIPEQDAKPYMLADFIDARPSWKSVSTRRKVANSIRAAFQWAADGERIARNPFKSVRYGEAERRPDLPDDVLDRIAAVSNKSFERAVRWLRLTGCRLSELCNAEWSHIDFERSLWVIPRHKSRKQTGKAKVVALVPEAVEMLHVMARATAVFPGAEAAFPNAALVGQRLFTNTLGRPWSYQTLGQQLRRLKRRKAIDTPATLHGIRHRFGTACIAGGAPLKLVSEAMGHASSSITEEYYVDLSNEMDAIRAAVSKGMPRK
jgi:integrase